MKKQTKAQVENRANFQAIVCVKFPKAGIPTLAKWFETDEKGNYTHIEIQELWTGWNMHRDFEAGTTS